MAGRWFNRPSFLSLDSNQKVSNHFCKPGKTNTTTTATKMFSLLTITVVLMAVSIGSNHAADLHRFHSGDCPKMETMSNFNIDRFLGMWYVLENANDNVRVCLREEFSANQESVDAPRQNQDEIMNELDHPVKPETDDSKEHKMEKVYFVKRSYLSFGERQFINETGKVKFLTNDSQAEMEISFPYSETGMLNLKNYAVISTDYDKYALVWRCQKTIFGHRRSAQLMSRYKSLDEKTMEELKTLLKHFEAEHNVKFQTVRQTDCLSNDSTRKPIDNRDSTSSSSDKVEANTDEKPKSNKKKLINIDVGGFHLDISYPFW